MENSDILKRFDNDKLIDVVKNYKRYGYDDEIRDYAINLLKERGWSIEDLKTFGYWKNSDYEEALIQYIIRKSKFPQNPKRSVRFSGKGTKRSVQKRKARNTQKTETKGL